MIRTQKYPETATFHYHNENPKNRITGDCAYRAIARATGKPYNEVVMDCAKVHCDTGYEPTEGKGLEELMKRYGWEKHSQPRKTNGTKFTGKEFCEQLQEHLRYKAISQRRYKRILANIGGHHMVAIIDGKVNDIWNSTGGCIGNYWTKGE